MARKKSSLQWQAFTSTLSTMLVLIMLGLTVLTMLTADKLRDEVRGNLSVTLRLQDEVTDSQAKTLQAELKKLPYITEAKYTSKEQVLAEQVDAMGSNPTDFLHENPYQGEIEISVTPGFANVDSLDWLADEMTARPTITDVIYQNDLVDNLNDNLRIITFVFLVISGLLLIISAALINSTVRLSVYSRRFIIHTMKLVGASWSFIRRPFMLRSMWIGLIAAIFADAILVGISELLINYDPEIARYITLVNLGIMSGCVIVCGLAITLICTFISVSHFLRLREDEMYK